MIRKGGKYILNIDGDIESFILRTYRDKNGEKFYVVLAKVSEYDIYHSYELSKAKRIKFLND